MAVEWHQDWAFYPHTNDSLLAFGLMLEDVNLENGPLQVIPGSHKGPVLSHHHNGIFCGAINPEDPDFQREKIVTLTGKAGSMTVQRTGDALKLVWPQPGSDVVAMEGWDFRHFLLQPLDDPQAAANQAAAMALVMERPKWRLSLQTHKLLGLR